jgi:hypothetical protein
VLIRDFRIRRVRFQHCRIGRTASLGKSQCPIVGLFGKSTKLVNVPRLRTREFEANNNGGKRQRTEIVASRVQCSPSAQVGQNGVIEEEMVLGSS